VNFVVERHFGNELISGHVRHESLVRGLTDVSGILFAPLTLTDISRAILLLAQYRLPGRVLPDRIDPYIENNRNRIR
jgi:hypothetical protein